MNRLVWRVQGVCSERRPGAALIAGKCAEMTEVWRHKCYTVQRGERSKLFERLVFLEKENIL